jgi:3-phenylpropionate/cinnamic acid dioxygenase small subunit
MSTKVSESVRREIKDFLYDEADLLDRGEFEQWLELFTEDATYRMPLRVTHDKAHRDEEFDDNFGHFDETKEMLAMRVKRLGTRSAWAEDPPSRTRHFVSNLRVSSLAADEVSAKTNLLLYRNRGDSPQHDILSAQRVDQLRKTAEGWRLCSRVIYLDQATLGTLNLSIFL